MAMSEEEKKQILAKIAEQMDAMVEGGTGSEVYRETGDWDESQIVDVNTVSVQIGRSAQIKSQQDASDANEWAEWLRRSTDVDISAGMAYRFQGQIYVYSPPAGKGGGKGGGLSGTQASGELDKF